jgi:hypothetical protein
VVIFGQKRSFWYKWPKTLSTEMLFGGQDWLFCTKVSVGSWYLDIFHLVKHL